MTFGDMADRRLLYLVITLIKSALPGIPRDDELAQALNEGSMEAFWIFSEDGEHAGLIAAQCGPDEDTGLRSFYIVSATIAPNVSERGWSSLLGYGRLLARERKCSVLQFDCTPDNQRVIEIGAMSGAKISTGKVLGADSTVRFTLEV